MDDFLLKHIFDEVKYVSMILLSLPTHVMSKKHIREMIQIFYQGEFLTHFPEFRNDYDPSLVRKKKYNSEASKDRLVSLFTTATYTYLDFHKIFKSFKKKEKIADSWVKRCYN